LVERSFGGRPVWSARNGMLDLAAAQRKMQREAKSSKMRHPERITF